MWLCWQEPIEVSYYPAKFGKDKHSDSGDIGSFGVSHICQDHGINGSRDIIRKSPLR